MKFVLYISALFLGFAAANREESLAVLEDMKNLQPAYKNYLDYTVNLVANAKLNSSTVIVNFHDDIIRTKEQYLKAAIAIESYLLTQLNSQGPGVDTNCLDNLRIKVTPEMNLRGRHFTTCIVAVDDDLTKEIDKVYHQLQLDGPSWTDSTSTMLSWGRIFLRIQQI
ncbi:uncharacterized protein LOC129744597 [Uranotaenia lowii]|uniref:uncharacterized protein LOC129744597 n=1 Tax=Uranotaenia lowii TaxID=190385 RepID=UPI002478F538|nr:uncharacterized protein LOC129744597 [Uranotaenia lowii]